MSKEQKRNHGENERQNSKWASKELTGVKRTNGYKKEKMVIKTENGHRKSKWALKQQTGIKRAKERQQRKGASNEQRSINRA